MVFHSLYHFVASASITPGTTQAARWVIGYLGPDSAMPLASFLAAVIGFVLIFWRQITANVRKVFRSVTHKDEPFVEPVMDAVQSDATTQKHEG